MSLSMNPTDRSSTSGLCLDLYKHNTKNRGKAGKKEGEYSAQNEALFQIEQSYALQAIKCPNGAPFILWQSRDGHHHINQGNCHKWTCPRCGQIRARQEYKRLVAGSQQIAQDDNLYWWTFTTPGGDTTIEQAYDGLYGWLNRALSAFRYNAKKQGRPLKYFAVAELQKRGHPHLHMITNYMPDDAVLVEPGAFLPNEIVAEVQGLWSDYADGVICRSGLGYVWQAAPVWNAVGAAAYVGKYMFKELVQAEFERRFRRIRVSRNWPKLADTGDLPAMPLLTYADWLKVPQIAHTVYTDDPVVVDAAHTRLVTNVVLVT